MNINLPNVETVTFRMQAHKRVGDPERHFTFLNMTSQNGKQVKFWNINGIKSKTKILNHYFRRCRIGLIR